MKPLTQKQYNFLTDKIMGGIGDFETLYILARAQVLNELKQNLKRAREELEFYRN